MNHLKSNLSLITIAIFIGTVFLMKYPTNNYLAIIASSRNVIPDTKKIYDKNEEEINNLIKNYWRISLEKNAQERSLYIEQPSNEFWNDCLNQNEVHKRANIPLSEPLPNRLGEGAGISENEKRSALFFLEYFSEQIGKGELELLDVKIARHISNEAVVKIKWRKQETNAPEINETFLVQKFNNSWKIIMMQTGTTYKKLIDNFAVDEKCSSEN